MQAIIYGWIFGIEKGQEELDRGALIKVPRAVSLLLKYVTPIFLVVILLGTIAGGGGYFQALTENPVAQKSVLVILAAIALLTIMVAVALRRWTRDGRFEEFEENGSKMDAS